MTWLLLLRYINSIPIVAKLNFLHHPNQSLIQTSQICLNIWCQKNLMADWLTHQNLKFDFFF